MRALPFHLAVGITLSLSGCGQTVTGQDGAAQDAAIDANLTALTCTAPNGGQILVDRTCSFSDDCILVLHQLDCCGSQQAVGIRASGMTAFARAEADCVMRFPGCGCPAGPTRADDGMMTTDMMRLRVRCDTVQCRTFVAP